jgi:hypothetical protein
MFMSRHQNAAQDKNIRIAKKPSKFVKVGVFVTITITRELEWIKFGEYLLHATLPLPYLKT